MPKPYTPNDRWSQRAAEEGYRARSVYKLKELDERFRLLKKNMTVLDLGAAPGSWLQYASEQIGNRGYAIGLDLTEIEPIAENVAVHQTDITDLQAVDAVLDGESVDKCNVIISDLAPKTSGIRDVDQWRSIELSQAVVAIAEKYLSDRGQCVFKVLRGADFDEFLRELKQDWETKVVQVKASRDRSKEVYVLLRRPK